MPEAQSESPPVFAPADGSPGARNRAGSCPIQPMRSWRPRQDHAPGAESVLVGPLTTRQAIVGPASSRTQRPAREQCRGERTDQFPSVPDHAAIVTRSMPDGPDHCPKGKTRTQAVDNLRLAGSGHVALVLSALLCAGPRFAFRRLLDRHAHRSLSLARLPEWGSGTLA